MKDINEYSTKELIDELKNHRCPSSIECEELIEATIKHCPLTDIEDACMSERDIQYQDYRDKIKTTTEEFLENFGKIIKFA